MAKLSRNQIVEVSGPETYADLEQALKAKPAGSKPPPKRLLLEDIRVADKVFQWRVGRENVAEKERHTLELARALRDTGEPLEPILVFSVNGKFYAVDGPHRLAAYRTVNWSKPIPVKVYDGSLHDAHLEALKRNSKDKLPITRQEKSEAAWKLVKLDRLKAHEVQELTTIGERTIWTMRRTWRELQQAEPESAADLSWTQALMWRRGQEPERPEDDWKQQEAKKIVDALLKAGIGQGLMKNPDITAQALAMLHQDLPGALIREWSASEPEAIQEALEAMTIDEGDLF